MNLAGRGSVAESVPELIDDLQRRREGIAVGWKPGTGRQNRSCARTGCETAQRPVASIPAATASMPGAAPRIPERRASRLASWPCRNSAS